jgi:hydroxymethylpyrimidine/phosphomethylpyrimidine kinase
MTPDRMRVVTIAGSDSSGGAGIQADLKTFQAFGVYGTSAITALTAQSRRAVTDIWLPPPASIDAQIAAILEDGPLQAGKTGMLATAEIVAAVAGAAKQHRLPNLVVDPVVVATSGARLLDHAGLEALRDALVPLARCITPNLPEAAALLGRPVKTVAEMKAAAADLCTLGCGAAVITGGHLPAGGDLVDVLFDGAEIHELPVARQPGADTHGTGCTFAAALASGLALGWDLLDSVTSAQDYVARALAAAPGKGGPLWHGIVPRRQPGRDQ